MKKSPIFFGGRGYGLKKLGLGRTPLLPSLGQNPNFDRVERRGERRSVERRERRGGVWRQLLRQLSIRRWSPGRWGRTSRLWSVCLYDNPIPLDCLSSDAPLFANILPSFCSFFHLFLNLLLPHLHLLHLLLLLTFLNFPSAGWCCVRSGRCRAAIWQQETPIYCRPSSNTQTHKYTNTGRNTISNTNDKKGTPLQSLLYTHTKNKYKRQAMDKWTYKNNLSLLSLKS